MKNSVRIVVLILVLMSCETSREVKTDYKDHIGDTTFNADLDDPQFQFCDSTKVLHRRALISYTGGNKALNKAILESYNYQSDYRFFSGYFIIRFAVNCKNESGRFRIQVLDTDFNSTKCPEDLFQHIQSVFKELKDWNHAIYNGKDYDSYTFRVIKIENGKIINT
ncbi:hypothetical protein [Psychroserpens sp. MEBiC05023]